MKTLKYLIFTIIIILMILNINIVSSSVMEASILFFKSVFVCIFPFSILSDVLIYYDYHLFLNKIFSKTFKKIFNISKNSSIIFILSVLSSLPCNSIYISNMLENNNITKEEANKILIFTYFPSIAFVIGIIGYKLYTVKIGIILLLVNYIYNVTIGLYLRKESSYVIKDINNNIEKDTLFNVLKDSILKAINSSITILGNMIIFFIIINLLNKYLLANNIIIAVLSGVLELTTGVFKINELLIPLNYKLALTSFILNFSSISIIFQSLSILSKYKFNIKKILIIKLIFSILFSILFLFYRI